MLLDYDEYLEQLRRSLRSAIENTGGDQSVRSAMASSDGFDRALWSVLAGQLGLTGLLVPTRYGGSGAGMWEAALVCEELGRSLACVPYLSSAVLSVALLLRCDDESARRTWLPGIAAGDAIATVAVAEDASGWRDDRITAQARRTDGGWALHGSKRFVVDGEIADLVLVVAMADSPALFAVDATAAGVHRVGLTSLDLTRRLADIHLDGATATRIYTADLSGALCAANDEVITALAAEQVGGAQRVLEEAVSHARTRHQFGRPIGSFQAVKHSCADMLADVESARATARYAAWCAANDRSDLPIAAAVAKAFCSEAYSRCAQRCLQVHGGMGFTWEHLAHLYLKRAKSAEVLFGTPLHYRRRLADACGF